MSKNGKLLRFEIEHYKLKKEWFNSFSSFVFHLLTYTPW